MCSKKMTIKYTENYSEQIHKLRVAINQSDAIMIGAGAGLSTAAGFAYAGERFYKHFSDFEAKYDFHDMYTGGFYPYQTLEEYWAYWSRYIYLNRFQDAPKPVYEELLQIVKEKDYFVLTTNVDHCFQKAGFDTNRLFYTQGDYGLFQCSIPCHNKTYKNEEEIYRMVKEQKGMRIPTDLIPYCPRCGEPMTMNLRSDGSFVEDEGWRMAASRYEEFILRYQKQKVSFLELGVGYNTPGIIRFVFPELARKNRQAFFARVNLLDARIPGDIAERSISLQDDCGKVIQDIYMFQPMDI